jgi:succinate-acetate transporter protein
MLTGRVGTNALPLIASWLLGGFVIQLIVGLLDLKSGNAVGGNAFTFFCGMFMLTGCVEMLLKYFAASSGNPLDTVADGWAWAAVALVLIMWTPAFCKTFSLLSVIVVLLDIALPFLALADMGLLPKWVTNISAYSLLICGFVGIYLGSAVLVNGVFGKSVYPLPGVKKK